MSVIQSLLIQFGKLGDPILKYKYGYHTQNGLHSYFLAPWKLIVHKGAVFSVVCENKFLLSYLRNTSRKSILFRIGDMLHDVFFVASLISCVNGNYIIHAQKGYMAYFPFEMLEKDYTCVQLVSQRKSVLFVSLE